MANYRVNLTVTEDRVFEIQNVNSPEEAESIAETLLMEGERGASGGVLDIIAESEEVQEIEGL